MIAKIVEMRTLSKAYRLQALSIAEIREPLNEFELKLARKTKFQGRQLKLGPILNAIALEFLSMSDDEQEKVAVKGLARLEAMLAQEGATVEETSSHASIAHETAGRIVGGRVAKTPSPEAETAGPQGRPRRKSS